MGARNNGHDSFSPASLVGAAIISTSWPGASSNGLSTDSPRFVELDSQMAFVFNPWSTGVHYPSTNSSGTTASSEINILQAQGHEHVYRIPGISTGYSITAATSGTISISFFHET
jgi:hypothetical protein